MAHFNLDEYVTVAERITQFWGQHPTGRIYTKLEFTDSKTFVVWAAVYKDASDPEPWATGLAEEHFGQSGPNQTSPLENCESSAIGRALANAGYATSSALRPSREEMDKVQRFSGEAPAAPKRPSEPRQQPAAPSGETIDKKRNGVIWYFFNKDGKAADAFVFKMFGVKRTNDLTIEQFNALMQELNPNKVQGRTILDYDQEKQGVGVVADVFGGTSDPAFEPF